MIIRQNIKRFYSLRSFLSHFPFVQKYHIHFAELMPSTEYTSDRSPLYVLFFYFFLEIPFSLLSCQGRKILACVLDKDQGRKIINPPGGNPEVNRDTGVTLSDQSLVNSVNYQKEN